MVHEYDLKVIDLNSDNMPFKLKTDLTFYIQSNPDTIDATPINDERAKRQGVKLQTMKWINDEILNLALLRIYLRDDLIKIKEVKEILRSARHNIGLIESVL